MPPMSQGEAWNGPSIRQKYILCICFVLSVNRFAMSQPFCSQCHFIWYWTALYRVNGLLRRPLQYNRPLTRYLLDGRVWYTTAYVIILKQSVICRDVWYDTWDIRHNTVNMAVPGGWFGIGDLFYIKCELTCIWIAIIMIALSQDSLIL